MISISYIRLCRFDAALISFFSYIIGVKLAGPIEGAHILNAFLITAISTNFIYAINAWSDREIDKINKAYRPIPSGKISPENALKYASCLFLLSIIFPFFIYTSIFTLILLLLLPILGVVYSLPPFRLKRFPQMAIIIICIGLNTPLLLGYTMTCGDLKILPFVFSLFLFCMCVIPLKQIAEVTEDNEEFIHNLYTRYGDKLLLFSVFGLILNGMVSYLILQNNHYFLFVLLIHISSLATIAIFKVFKFRLSILYDAIIRVVVINCFLIFFILSVKR